MAIRSGKSKNSNETIVAAIGDVSERMAALVHDEIELAKTEVAEKASSLGRGAAAVGVGAVFGYFALIFLLIAVALVIDGIFFSGLTFVWVGFAIVAGLLLVLGVGAFLLARKLFKVGVPKPTMAIDEAKKIRETVTASATAPVNGNGSRPALATSPNGNGNGHSPVSPDTVAAVAAAAQASAAHVSAGTSRPTVPTGTIPPAANWMPPEETPPGAAQSQPLPSSAASGGESAS